jgi:DNA-binding response OmpR family regulator
MDSDGAVGILIVEDDLVLAGFLVRHLQARGHDARVAGSAEDARAMLSGGFRPTVVLLDINLPGESGWSFLRSNELAAAGSPRVYIESAVAVPSQRLREFGIAGYLPKPFALSTLVEIVERDAGRDEAPGVASEEGITDGR